MRAQEKIRPRMARHAHPHSPAQTNPLKLTLIPLKLSSLNTVDYLRSRAELADLAAFDRIMKKIPSGPPDPGDELPAKYKR
jgi:hypothetical protein